jgi:hypothetical protein
MSTNDDALALASRTPCVPKTLARAARDYADKQPAFAVGAGALSLHWLVHGYGCESTGADVWEAYRATLAAAERQGRGAEVGERFEFIAFVGGAEARCLGERDNWNDFRRGLIAPPPRGALVGGHGCDQF